MFFFSSFLPFYIKKHSCLQVTRLLRYFLSTNFADSQIILYIYRKLTKLTEPMDQYYLYHYSFSDRQNLQRSINFDKNVEESLAATKDKNLWLDRLFGGRNTFVRIQTVKKGKGADKYPCTVLNHEDRIVFLRIENEKLLSVYKKTKSNPSDIAIIDKIDVTTNPYSYVIIDCREGKDMIAIKQSTDAFRSTDIIAKLLQESLNSMMENLPYSFELIIEPITMPKDFWDYNRHLIKKEGRNVKKMTIYFKAGSINPKVESFINNTPYIKRLLKEDWSASHGQVTLYDPVGSKVVDGRKRDIKNIIELITSNIDDTVFGISLLYNNGIEITCGKDIRLPYPMKEETFLMLFVKDLIGETTISLWLDQASDFISKQKNEKLTENRRKRKAAKKVSELSSALSLF